MTNPDLLMLVAPDLDAETLGAVEARLNELKCPQPERRTLAEWLHSPRPEARLLCLLSDAEIRLLLNHEQVGQWQIAILPLKSNRSAQASFGVPGNLAVALKGVLEMDDPVTIDLLTCNGEVMLGTLIIGNVWGLQSNRVEEQFWPRVWETLSHLGSLRLQAFSFTTGKGQVQDLAAMGCMVFGYDVAGSSATAISSELMPNDGKLNALVLSPTSVMSHLWFLLKLRFLHRLSLQQLPDSVGFIRTNALTINSQQPQAATRDGEKSEGSEWVVAIREKAARILIARKRQVTEEEGSSRESLRTTHLPSLATSRMLRDQSLPLFPHAAEADFRELFRTLRESAKTTTAFIILMILSTLLASTGLFLNSASVIIGAMILAPLMAPIISLSMGIVRSEDNLIRTSLRTLLFGLLVALSCAALFALITPLHTITPEMDSRLHPSLLDLMVALLSGVAGAYANAKEEIAKSLAGVAIAVALVPPLAVTGIGIGWMHPELVWGASLLFLTNLIGIMLAASVTFLALGFAPVSRARKALLLSLSLVALIAIPLGLAFQGMVHRNSIHLAVSSLGDAYPEDGVFEVREVILGAPKPVIRLQVRVRGRWDDQMLARQKARIEQRLGQPVEVEYLVVYVR
jgi:uncharacterized hydrophobic protein (TIGR00271 family)